VTLQSNSKGKPSAAEARQTAVREPDGFKTLRRLANLLPKSRRLSNGGVHPLLMRKLTNELLANEFPAEAESDLDREISRMFYLRSYVKELPLALQVFVLNDQDLRYVEMEPGTTGPLNESCESQLLENFALLDQPEQRLRQVFSEAEERISIETSLAQDQKEGPDDSQEKPKKLTQLAGKKSRVPKAVQVVNRPIWPADYAIGDNEYLKVGLNILIDRATQRFFFILAAEEMLDALAAKNTEEGLNVGWYDHAAGATRGWLFLDKKGRVKQDPPLLFSLVVGLQANRVHRCENCADYFWAGRTNKKVCSEACGASARKRIQRKRDREIKLGDRIPKRRSKLPGSETKLPKRT
jgi:hypothetical protein